MKTDVYLNLYYINETYLQSNAQTKEICRKVHVSSISRIGPIPKKWGFFLYVPENEIKEDILGWNLSHLTGSVNSTKQTINKKNNNFNKPVKSKVWKPKKNYQKPIKNSRGATNGRFKMQQFCS